MAKICLAENEGKGELSTIVDKRVVGVGCWVLGVGCWLLGGLFSAISLRSLRLRGEGLFKKATHISQIAINQSFTNSENYFVEI